MEKLAIEMMGIPMEKLAIEMMHILLTIEMMRTHMEEALWH